MSQAAAIFLSSILPTAAGAPAVGANTTAQGETFAAALAQLQASLSPQNTNPIAPPTAPASPDAPALTVFGIAPKPSANLHAPKTPGLLDSAALQSQAEPSLPDQAETPALLDASATFYQVTAQASEQPAGAPTIADGSPQSNAPTTPTQQSSNPAPVVAQIALRGSLIEQAGVGVPTAEKQPQVKALETPPAVAPPGQAPTPTTTKSAAAPKRATSDQPAQNQSQQSDAPQTKPADSAQPTASQPQASSANGNPIAPQAQLPSADAPTAPAPQPIAAATAQPALPSHIEVQQLTTAVVAAAPQAAVPVDALAVHIARKAEAGVNQFEIRLHPAELGQLDISLTVADDGQVQAMLRVERPETLEMLQRDARSLEQQLRQAGLEVGSNALSFSLSGGNSQRHAPFSGWPGFADAQGANAPKDDVVAAKYLAVRLRDGIDIRV